ncbi:hypothetical protein AB0H00_29370 [Nocardia sp. NPDC023852]|uniref:hypothetical protein n=1 Tax=Nocardia sp. NPDC023852 TaxID=3154697 RepID=UPI0033C49598
MPLADILRTNAQAHRTLPVDRQLARAITVPARSVQDAIVLRQASTRCVAPARQL